MARMRVPDSLRDQRDAPVSLQCLPNEDLNGCHHDVEGAGCISQKSSLAASVFEGSMTVPVLPSEFPLKVETLWSEPLLTSTMFTSFSI